MKHRALSELGISPEIARKLQIYLDLVLAWNRTINLISRGDETNLRGRHLEDSLSLLQYLPTGFQRAIDLGSGAGFPGIPLALATGQHFDLVEADNRKAAFLREAARLTGASVTVHVTRIERVSLARADLITARALAPLEQLMSWSEPLLAAHGQCVFPKGKLVHEELTRARERWHMRLEQFPSPLRPDVFILRLSEISRV